MTTSMFGVPLGFRTYDEDKAKLALMGAQTQHQQALTGLNQVQTEQIRGQMAASAEARARLAKLQQLEAAGQVEQPMVRGNLTEPSPSDPDGMSALSAAPSRRAAPADSGDAFQQAADRLRRRAELYLRAGMDKEAGDLLKEASQVHAQVSTARANSALSDRRRVETSLKLAERLADIFVDVDSPESHARAVMTWMNDPQLQGQALPAELRQYNPEAIRQAVSASKIFMEKEKLKLQGAAEQRLAEVARDGIVFNKVRTGVLTGRLALDKESEARRDREGGKSKYASATPADREAARKMIVAMGYDLADEGEESVLSEYSWRFADRARRLVDGNKGVTSMEQALSQVMLEAQAGGELPAVPAKRQPRPTIGGVIPLPRGKDPVDRSKAPGMSPPAPTAAPKPPAKPTAKALPLPKSRSELVAGQSYTAPDGRVKTWTGTGWKE